MEIYKELKKIIEYQNSIKLRRDRKSEEEIINIVEEVNRSYRNKKYDFSKYLNITLNQDSKKRKVKLYPEFSCEEVLCIYLKRLLDRKIHVRYPNRNKFIHSLFDILNAVKDMNDYTIIKFDFKDFFNSVSSLYVYKKFIESVSLERYQKDLIYDFVNETKYTYAGFNTSNILCEIAAIHFDEKLKLSLNNYGLIFYRRYIDDGILIFNRYISCSECVQIIDNTIKSVFYDSMITCDIKCKTKLNKAKTRYISKRELQTIQGPKEFDFLGYLFELSFINGKTEFKYGITQKKIDKYSRKIDEILEEYNKGFNKDIELLRHQIKAFTSRTVYRITKYKTDIWKTKGFISNYCELRYHLDKLVPNTEKFLKNAVTDSFFRKNIPIPYFLKGNQDESIYNLYNNLKYNRTLLFIELIGIRMCTIQKMCEQVGIMSRGNKNYDGLVRDYLIKVRVGH
ncbi:MAG: hypothetical protein ACLS2V_15180 [Clostridium paraputrificum]|uniref:hypothetical protein n=1 Tax=Clostridium paraputrificum TaxID=29363 RepID=UPI00189DC779|nr:hypothetical protein [Clostridium paraputrificum]